MNRSRLVDDARVTIERARADEEFIVIDFRVQDLKDDRRNGGMPVALDPILASGPPEALPPHYVRLTDAAGRHLELIEASIRSPEPGDRPDKVREPRAHMAVFASSGALQPGSAQPLRFVVSLHQWAVPPARESPVGVLPGSRPHIGPFAFDLEVPVQRVPVVEVDQEVEANGVALTLERVVNSLAKPEAIVRFVPPDDGRVWVPRLRKDWLQVKGAAAPGQQEGSRWSLRMDGPVEGHSSLTVEYLRGMTPGGSPDGIRMICGPWTFEFDAPVR